MYDDSRSSSWGGIGFLAIFLLILFWGVGRNGFGAGNACAAESGCSNYTTDRDVLELKCNVTAQNAVLQEQLNTAFRTIVQQSDANTAAILSGQKDLYIKQLEQQATQLFITSQNEQTRNLITMGVAQAEAKSAAQCIELGVPLTKIKCQWSKIDRKYDLGNGVLVKRPEDVVMNILRAEGYSGTPYEFSPYQMLMQASCLDYVKECSKSIFLENPHSRTFSVQLDMYGMDKDKASRLIKSAGWLAVKRDFEEIYENHQIREWFPYLSFDDVSMVFNALTRKKFEKMVDLFFDNPEENSIGWPDIIACKDNKLRMIEVKTTDKIRDTQRRMFPIITDVLGVPVEVFQLEKKYEKQNNT